MKNNFKKIMIDKNKVIVKKLAKKKISEKSFKEQIFKGTIFIFESSFEIKEILKISERYFIEIFDITLDKFNRNIKINKDHNRLFYILQTRVKNCKFIRKKFSIFLGRLGLKINETFMDMISMRFSPSIGMKRLGSLKPAPPHRDTWASNIFNQINFWVPFHNVKKESSIYIVPKYFSSAISNNSALWSYHLHKKSNDYPSVPETRIFLHEQDKVSFDLLKGEVLCFSGHHLHGSKVGIKQRINLETRIVNRNDNDLYNIPKNLDSKNNEKKSKWFRNLETQEYY